MTVNIRMPDAQLGDKDLDDEYITDAWLIDQWVGNLMFSCGYNGVGELGRDTSPAKLLSSPGQIGSLVSWKYVTGGVSSVHALKNDGTLWAWGWNSYGELGNGTRDIYGSPIQIGSLTTWKQISHGGGFWHAIKTDGTLWGCGYNGGTGALGVGNTSQYSSPVQIGSMSNWKQVCSGQNAGLAIQNDGKLYAWGYNTVGQLGLGDTTTRLTPVQVGTLSNWKQVTCAYGSLVGAGDIDHTAAIKTDGTLWSWGYNDVGQLGRGNTINYSSPVQVGSLSNWKRLGQAFGRNTWAIKTDGTLWCWGHNNSGQLGIGNTINYSSPIQVGSLTNWKYVSCQGETTMAVKTDGTLWVWGRNDYGQLGIGNVIFYSSPVQVGSLTNWKQATPAFRSTYGITYREI